MSCVPNIRASARPGILTAYLPLPRSTPAWTAAKMRRLERFANSETVALRAVAAGHPRTPRSTIGRLLLDEDVTVRRAAVKNPMITYPQLLQAIHDADMGIAAYARLLTTEEIDSG